MKVVVHKELLIFVSPPSTLRSLEAALYVLRWAYYDALDQASKGAAKEVLPEIVRGPAPQGSLMEVGGEGCRGRTGNF